MTADIQDCSWVPPGRDQDIFALHLTESPGDEEARSARKVQCKNMMISHEETWRNLYIFFSGDWFSEVPVKSQFISPNHDWSSAMINTLSYPIFVFKTRALIPHLRPVHSGLIRSEMWPKLMTHKLLKWLKWFTSVFNTYRFRIISPSCSEEEFDLSAGVSE